MIDPYSALLGIEMLQTLSHDGWPCRLLAGGGGGVSDLFFLKYQFWLQMIRGDVVTKATN